MYVLYARTQVVYIHTVDSTHVGYNPNPNVKP